MNRTEVRAILNATDFVHQSGTKEEKQVAALLKEKSEALGAEARIEPFEVAMAKVSAASLVADGKEIPARAIFCAAAAPWKHRSSICRTQTRQAWQT